MLKTHLIATEIHDKVVTACGIEGVIKFRGIDQIDGNTLNHSIGGFKAQTTDHFQPTRHACKKCMKAWL